MSFVRQDFRVLFIAACSVWGTSLYGASETTVLSVEDAKRAVAEGVDRMGGESSFPALVDSAFKRKQWDLIEYYWSNHYTHTVFIHVCSNIEDESYRALLFTKILDWQEPLLPEGWPPHSSLMLGAGTSTFAFPPLRESLSQLLGGQSIHEAVVGTRYGRELLKSELDAIAQGDRKDANFREIVERMNKDAEIAGGRTTRRSLSREESLKLIEDYRSKTVNELVQIGSDGTDENGFFGNKLALSVVIGAIILFGVLGYRFWRNPKP